MGIKFILNFISFEETPTSAGIVRRIPLKSRFDSISSTENTTNDSNTTNIKEDVAPQAIYENGEFQLIEHLLQQQDKEEEPKINLPNNTPQNDNETELILVREELHHTLPPRYNQPIINQTKIRTTTSSDYTMHNINTSSSSPLASFQPGQATNILQQRNENFLKNSTNIITNLSPMVNQRPLPQVPTKPRTIITLPHLMGARNRNQNQQIQQQQQQNYNQNSSQTANQPSNKTPIIIRERIEPPILSISTPTTINITSIQTNAITSLINTNSDFNSNQIKRVSSSSPSTNSSSTNQIYSTSSSSNSSSPASSTSSQNSVPITILSRQNNNNQVNFNPVVSPSVSNKINNVNKSPVITSNETSNTNNTNTDCSPLKNSLQNKIVLNAATFTPSANFTYEINSSKLNAFISTSNNLGNDKNNNTREASANENSQEFSTFTSMDNKYERINLSPKSSTGVIFLYLTQLKGNRWFFQISNRI